MPHAPALPVKDKFLPGLPVRLSRMKEVIKSTRPPGHKSYSELVYLTGGAGWHCIDFVRYPVVPHTCYLIGPGQVHHWELSEIPRSYVLMVKEEFLERHPAPVPLDEVPAGLTFAPEDDVLAALWALLERESPTPRTWPPRRPPACTCCSCGSGAATPGPPRTTALPPLVQAYKQAVDAHYPRLHLVKEYAGRLHATSRYLNLLCQQALGQSASRVIAQRLAHEAKRQLLFTPNTVAQIAGALGFADPSYFSKFYRQQTGRTPGAYRQSIS